MRELVELQTGQVAFLSGLLAGFALSVAAHILRYGVRSRVARLVFIMMLISSLSFLLALYVDTRLAIELAGRDALAPEIMAQVADIRVVGTLGATFAFFVFVASIGLLGWLATPLVGVVSTALAVTVLGLLVMVWRDIGALVAVLPN